MNIKTAIITLFWLLSLPAFVLAKSSPAHQKAAAASAGDSSVKLLTVTQWDGTSVVDANTGIFDMGNINPLTYNDGSEYTISHEFVLVNRNKNAVVIRAIQGSNSFAEYDLPPNNKPLPVTIPPEGLVTIRLHYHLLPLTPGKVNTSDMVFINDQVQPAATLRLVGTVRSVVVFDPPQLDFGVMTPGQVVSKTLKITYDKYMYMGMPLPISMLPRVASDLSFVTLKQTSVEYTKQSQFLDLSNPNLDERRRYGKNYDRHIKEKIKFLDTLPSLNNIVTYQVIAKAPTEAGVFTGFIWILPVYGTPGTEVLKQECIKVQGQVVAKN